LKRIKNKKNGFTLIELLLVIALLAISVGVTNDILISLIRANNKTQVMNEIEQQSNFLSLKIEKELRNASSVDIPDSVDESSTILQFNTKDDETITYDVTSGVVYRNGVPITSNISPGGIIASCSGEGGTNDCFSLSGVDPQVVNINIDFTQAQSGPSNSYTGKVGIKSTIVLRNTY
jgi:prepilin-type N-terminal cleavage/methylation domain-containing protein